MQNQAAQHRVAQLEQEMAAQASLVDRVRDAVLEALSDSDGPLVVESLEGRTKVRKKLSADELYALRVRNAAKARLSKTDLGPEARRRHLETAEKLDAVPEDFDREAFLAGEAQPEWEDDDDQEEEDDDEFAEDDDQEWEDDDEEDGEDDEPTVDLDDPRVAEVHACIAMNAEKWLKRTDDLRSLWLMERLSLLCNGRPDHVQMLRRQQEVLALRSKLSASKPKLRPDDRYENGQGVTGYGGDDLYYPSGSRFLGFGTLYYPNGTQLGPLPAQYPNGYRAFDGRQWYRPNGEWTTVDDLLIDVLDRFPRDRHACEAGLVRLRTLDQAVFTVAVIELVWMYLRR